MGWDHLPWYTLTDDFDKDFGPNAFSREGDRGDGGRVRSVFRTLPTVAPECPVGGRVGGTR